VTDFWTERLPLIAPEAIQYLYQVGQNYSFHWNYTFGFNYSHSVLLLSQISTDSYPIAQKNSSAMGVPSTWPRILCSGWGQNSVPKNTPDEQRIKNYWEYQDTSTHLKNDEGFSSKLCHRFHSLLVVIKPGKQNYYLSS